MSQYLKLRYVNIHPHFTSLTVFQATNIVQIKSRRNLQPLIDIVLQRCTYIMGRLFDISVEILKKEEDEKGMAIVSLYEHFMTELRARYFAFIESIEAECKYVVNILKYSQMC